MRYSIQLLFLFICLNSRAQSTENAYAEELKKIESERIKISQLFVNADSLSKTEIIETARQYLISELKNKIFPAWYGTPWEFHGHSRIPRKGAIACGYFVTNTLSDIGYKIPRVKWAQSASEYFILILSDNKVRRFRNKTINEVENHIKSSGEGLYLVGLDIHVGFILYTENKMKFIHSNYYRPDSFVVSQDLSPDTPLADSNYRVIGKLFSDQMIVNWITSREY